MTEFFASLGIVGWFAILGTVFGLVTLRQGLREMLRRPWTDPRGTPGPTEPRDDARPGTRPDHPDIPPG